MHSAFLLVDICFNSGGFYMDNKMSLVLKSTTTKKFLKNPKLYVVTILIDREEEELKDRVNEFFHSLTCNDGSFNIMYADKRIIEIGD